MTTAATSRSRRFLSGVSLGYLYQATVMLAVLWLTPFFLKHIGQHDYGVWLVAMQILAYLMLMDFGVVALLPRETAYATGREISGKEGKNLTDVIGRTALVVLHQTPFVALAVAIFWFFMPAAVHDFKGPVMVIMAGFTALFPLRIFQAVLQGLQDMAFLGRSQMLGWVLSTALAVLAVLAGLGLYAMAIGWVAMQATVTVLSFYRLRRHFPGALPSRLPKMSWRELAGSMSGGLWVSASQVAQVLIGCTDYLMIGQLLGPSAVVPYACTNKLITAMGNQPTLLMEMAAPGLSQMKTCESPDRIFKVASALTLGIVTVSGVVACVSLAVNHSFVNWWLGQAQFGGAPLTVALIASMLLRHWNTTTVYSVFSLGYERRICVTTLLDGLVSVCSGIALIQLLGPIGAPLGSIAGVCLVSLPVNLSTLAREVRVSILSVLLAIWPWFWRFAILAAVAAALGLKWHASLAYIAGIASLTGVVYGAIMLPMIMNSDLRAYLPSPATRLWDSVCGRFSLGTAITQDSIS